MKIKRDALSYLSALLLIFCFLGHALFACAGDISPSLSIPVHPKAIEVKHYFNEPPQTKAVAYTLTAVFPAQNVISFYDEEFRKMGFIEYSEDGYGTREWEDFDPQSGKWKKTLGVPARYIATWTDKEKKMRIYLVMRYKFDHSNKNWDRKLLISCTASSFFRLHDSKSIGK